MRPFLSFNWSIFCPLWVPFPLWSQDEPLVTGPMFVVHSYVDIRSFLGSQNTTFQPEIMHFSWVFTMFFFMHFSRVFGKTCPFHWDNDEALEFRENHMLCPEKTVLGFMSTFSRLTQPINSHQFLWKSLGFTVNPSIPSAPDNSLLGWKLPMDSSP